MGITLGCAFNALAESSVIAETMGSARMPVIIFGAIAVGISILMMTITNSEHPPACGMALGLVLNQWTWETLVFILGAVLFLVLVRIAFKRHLINLM